ncbi:MAG TPA: hypothetical protein VHL31_01810 [Geminicoccus sp.]|jgi:hypothetical protein|uniref:hypothetical protein n=1 Tax=Geminicoccus sp. TaxID=2024832 RepID=UPI002E30730D|nr:hypothetical protein [Geminicoccus sp.]HEX2525022.1 hypothetical protein [Geminicoccus sp.]
MDRKWKFAVAGSLVVVLALIAKFGSDSMESIGVLGTAADGGTGAFPWQPGGLVLSPWFWIGMIPVLVAFYAAHRAGWLRSASSRSAKATAPSVLSRQRRLTQPPDDALMDIILETFPRDGTWELMVRHDDPEACTFGLEIRTFMEDHGFQVAGTGVIRAVLEQPTRDLRLERRGPRYRLIVGSAMPATGKPPRSQGMARHRPWSAWRSWLGPIGPQKLLAPLRWPRERASVE